MLRGVAGRCTRRWCCVDHRQLAGPCIIRSTGVFLPCWLDNSLGVTYRCSASWMLSAADLGQTCCPRSDIHRNTHDFFAFLKHRQRAWHSVYVSGLSCTLLRHVSSGMSIISAPVAYIIFRPTMEYSKAFFEQYCRPTCRQGLLPAFYEARNIRLQFIPS